MVFVIKTSYSEDSSTIMFSETSQNGPLPVWMSKRMVCSVNKWNATLVEGWMSQTKGLIKRMFNGLPERKGSMMWKSLVFLKKICLENVRRNRLGLIKGCSKVLGCEWATRMRNSWNSENEFWKRGWILSSVLLSKRAILKTEIVSNNEIFHEMRFDKWYRSPMDYPVWMWIMICLGCCRHLQ